MVLNIHRNHKAYQGRGHSYVIFPCIYILEEKNLKHWFMTSFRTPTTAMNGSKFVTDFSDYTRHFFLLLLPTLFMPAQVKPKSFELRQNSFFFTGGKRASCLHACLDTLLLSWSY